MTLIVSKERQIMQPELKIKDGQYFVTDGEIDGSKFIVKKQPSQSAINFLQSLFIDSARRIISEMEDKQ